jgi:hypothetical protein
MDTLRRTIVVLDPGHGDVQLVVAVRAPRAVIDPERSDGFEDEFSYEMGLECLGACAQASRLARLNGLRRNYVPEAVVGAHGHDVGVLAVLPIARRVPRHD